MLDTSHQRRHLPFTAEAIAELARNGKWRSRFFQSVIAHAALNRVQSDARKTSAGAAC